ncbi:PBSX family phage terminase large subunit [Candidatus Fermentibacteria bacterium]|nr:MAG: PBSX family phage terminase large subunit [Candidatus Fermentibacteria bacterium]
MKVNILDSFEALFRPKRYKCFYGGRGGSKSYGFAQALVAIGASKPTRILCTREFQGSIKESVHRLLCDTIDRMGLGGFYDITQTSIVGKNGTTFLFEGLKNNITKIKSLEGVDVVWCEEAENITEFSWDILIPTIRKADSEIWISFNPYDELDSTYDRFITPYINTLAETNLYEDDRHYVRKVSYHDNPYFPQELRDEMEQMKAENYNKYLHIWEGEPSVDFEDSLIMPEWFDAAVDAHKKLNWKVRGIKTIGFDPADEGNDSKAYSVRHGPVVTDVQQWKSGNLEDGVERVFNAARDQKLTDITYDSIGVGAGCRAIFAKYTGNSNIQVQPFNGAESPDEPGQSYKDDRANGDVFRNKRAQYYWYLRDRFEATYRAVKHGDFMNPEDMISISSDIKDIKLLKGELTRIQRKRGRSDNMSIQIESKQDMKARGMRSPNMADSLVYTFASKIKTTWGESIDYSKMDRSSQRM